MDTPHRVTQSFRYVSPSQADQWLTHNVYPYQRPLRSHHVSQLTLIMQQGLFREGTTISFALFNGQRILMNGQHTLHALIRAGAPLRLMIEDHRVKTHVEMAQLYSTFDVQMKRNATDIYTAYDFARLHNMSKPSMKALSAALPIIVGGFLPATRGKDHPVNIYLSNHPNRHAVMHEWAMPAAAYFKAFDGGVNNQQRSQAQRANVAAVGILTFRYQPAHAQEFWSRIAHREMLTSAMPEYRLCQYLDQKVRLDTRAGFLYARAVAAAWNAAFTQRTMGRGLAPRKIDLPMLIEGTPFNGTRNLMYFQDGTVTWDPVEVGN